MIGPSVSHMFPLYVVVFNVGGFLPTLPGVLFSLSIIFLAQEIHTYSKIGFHI